MAATPLNVDGKQLDVGEAFNLLDSNDRTSVEEIQNIIQENLRLTKESWLVHSIVDYYYISRSETAATILAELREPHYKHLIDKLNEGIKSLDHRLYAMKLVLSIVCNQPIWIHCIVTHPVFHAIIKCLKSETDIPVLTTGIAVITVLLPAVPSLMNPHLGEIFEIFSRLTGFNSKKPGNVPDVFLLYLQVALYSLFHRLYGMYPSNFLTYLKNYYCKKENSGVYEEFVKPMLERVRLHPLLITSSREFEISSKRWKQMEAQDVLVECCRMSLDPIEGSWEESQCPVLSPRYTLYKSLIYKDTLSSHPGTPSKDSKTMNQVVMQDQSPINTTSAMDTSVLCSPSMVIGLSTPPPSQRNTPASSFLETSASFQQSLPGTYGNTPLMTPPVNTPRATPPITDELDKSRAGSKGSGPKGQDPKRQSTGSVISGKVPPNLVIPMISNPSSVPPSPLKTEFTELPPFGTLKSQPVKSAVRELCFDSIVELDSRSVISPKTFTKETSNIEKAVEAVAISNTDDDRKLSEIESVLKKDPGQEAELVGSFPVDSLSKVMERLESHMSDTVDEEVSEITQIDHDPEITAESVAQFMKSVNRIRFNSLTATNNVEKILGEKKFNKLRSRSCPHLPELMSPDLESGEPEPLSRSVSSTFKGTFEPTEENLEEESEADNNVTVSLPGQKQVWVSKSSSVIVSSSGCDTLTLTSDTIATDGNTTCPVYSTGISVGNVEFLRQNNVTELDLLKTVLSTTTIPVCQKCGNQTMTDNNRSSKTGSQLFSNDSPPELLDKHIQLGGEIHAKELSNIPITSRDSVNWTHFGGMPPADEINILRGQIFMIQNQLMYERHKRELHSKRNRRLLRKIVNAQTLEEQNIAMKDQLNLQETEIQNLKVSSKILQEEKRRLKDSMESNDYEKLCEIRSARQENEDLKSAKTELNNLLVRQREEQDLLKKDLQTTHAKLFEAEKEITHLKEQVEVSQKLKEQVLDLHKELLLMGELHQKCQEKLQATKLGNNAKSEQDYLIATLKSEIKVLKAQLEHQNIQTDASKARIEELEELSKNREMAFTELKSGLDTVKASHNDEIKALEDKYQNSLKINQQLESQILLLYSKIDELETSKQVPNLVKHTTDIQRERTESDPTLQTKPQKKPLSKMSSVPLHCKMEAEQTQLQCRNISAGAASYACEEMDADILDREGTSIVTSSHQHEADSASVSSRESGLFHFQSRTSTLSLSEGEDRSTSSRGSNLFDSGYVG